MCVCVCVCVCVCQRSLFPLWKQISSKLSKVDIGRQNKKKVSNIHQNSYRQFSVTLLQACLASSPGKKIISKLNKIIQIFPY